MVSVKLRLFQVLLVIFINTFATGVIFGFAALKPVLIRKGVYSELCETDDSALLSSLPLCENQELRLNNMFVTSVTVTNMASLPAGALLDHFGPTRTSIFGAMLFGLGNLVFGCGYIPWPVAFDGYSVGFTLMAIGSPLIFLSSFHISNSFPRHAGLILNCIMAAFNASSTPYAFYNWIDKKTSGVSIKTWFWCYTVIPALFVVLQGLAGPKSGYMQEPLSSANETTSLNVPSAVYSVIPNTDLPVANARDSSQTIIRRDAFIGAVSHKSTVGQVLSRHFWVLLIFFSIYADRINWLIQTMSEQLVFHLHDPAMAEVTTTIFSILLPLGGIIGVPIFGWLLDNRTVLDASLVILVGGFIYGIMGMLRSTVAQIVSISVFVILRPLLYVFVGDYCGKAFGFQSFGKIYGLATTLVGLFGLVLGPLNRLVKGPLNGNYDIINAAGLVTGILSSIMISWSIYTSSKARQPAA